MTATLGVAIGGGERRNELWVIAGCRVCKRPANDGDEGGRVGERAGVRRAFVTASLPLVIARHRARVGARGTFGGCERGRASDATHSRVAGPVQAGMLACQRSAGRPPVVILVRRARPAAASAWSARSS